jgi:GNAT superfamily N-acetyltransferase
MSVGNPGQELYDSIVSLAASLKEEDLEDPAVFGLCFQLLQLLDPQPPPLPQELIEQLAQVPGKADRFRAAVDALSVQNPQDFDTLVGSMKAAGLLKSEVRVEYRRHSWPGTYPWHDEEHDEGSRLEKSEPIKPPQATNEQAAGAGVKTYHNIAQQYGTITPGQKTHLDHYNYAPHENKIDSLITHHGFKAHMAGGKYGKFDLKGKNYNTKDLLIYDPSPSSGGDFQNEATTRSWRKIHELSHALTYGDINAKYGEGRRLGKLGQRSVREAKRAVEWEWMAAHKQRELSEKVGVKIPDDQFHKELNTVMHDAVHRAIHGKFTEPSDEGFSPHSHKISLEHAHGLIDQHAKQMGMVDNEKPPEMKTEAEMFHKSDNWKKEGYQFNYAHENWESGPVHSVMVNDKSGEKAAHFRFAHDKDGTFSAFSSHVYPEHRRKGIATEAYRLVEEKSGHKISPGVTSSEADALWSQPNRPFGKSEEIEKGEKGDWQKEGYSLKTHKPLEEWVTVVGSDGQKRKVQDNTYHRITAHSPSGEKVGDYSFFHHPKNNPHEMFVSGSSTHPEHRRKGLASAAYALAEKNTGAKIQNNPENRTETADALWNQPNRKFGKSEVVEKARQTLEGLKKAGWVPKKAAVFMGANDKTSVPGEAEPTHLMVPGAHVVDHGKHGWSGPFSINPEQAKLNHGLDFTTHSPVGVGITSGAGFLRNQNTGERALVKPSSGFVGAIWREKHGWNLPNSTPSHREVLFHNMANDYFNMGHHVPTTSGFTLNNEHWSAMKEIQGNAPGKLNRDQYNNTLENLHGSGDLHKLAMMDSIMGNHDRHRANMMVDSNKDHLWMIDHGLTFDYAGHGGHFLPGYLKDLHENKGIKDEAVHPEAAKWLKGLDSDKAKKLLSQYGYSEHHPIVSGFMRRLQAAKESLYNKDTIKGLISASTAATSPHAVEEENDE